VPWGIEVCVVGPGSVATPIWDKGKQQAADGVTGLSPAHRELYGKQLEAFGRAVVEIAEAGVPPEQVAAAIEAALTDARPKPRVTIGRDAKGQLVAARLLPTRWFNRVVRRAMKLPR
jgi:short-subunit dehydrogenase